MDIYIDKAEALIYENNKIENKLMVLAVFIELYNKMVDNALRYNPKITNNTRNIFINALEFCLRNTQLIHENTNYKTLMNNFLAILSSQEDIVQIKENNNLIKTIKPKLEEYFLTLSYVDVIDNSNIDFQEKVKAMRIAQILIEVFYKNIKNQYNNIIALKLKQELVTDITFYIPTILTDEIDGSIYRKQIKKQIKKFTDETLEKGTLKIIPDEDNESMEILDTLTELESKIYLQLKKYYLACYLPNDPDFRDILYELSDEVNMTVKEYLETKKNLEEKINNYYFKTKVKIWNK